MDLDSDFYGDEETVSRLSARVALSAPGTAPPQSYSKLNVPYQLSSEMDIDTPDAARLHNPYEGVRYAWQLGETVDAFLARLPPSTTPVTIEDHWIYISNPHVPAEPTSQSAKYKAAGCEGGAPLQSDTMLDLYIQGGMERLHLLSDFMAKSKSTAKSKTIAARDIGNERTLAVSQILDLAHHLHVRCGKWMLFPSPDAVDDVWATVARATAAGELGVAAKVSPKVLYEAGGGSARLICVYTRNFTDKGDVARVLGRMKELQLLPRSGKPIYYKCDAYTYLGIGSKNAWNIRASLYSSVEMLACTKSHGEAE